MILFLSLRWKKWQRDFRCRWKKWQRDFGISVAIMIVCINENSIIRRTG
ncbi:hypothetical protein LTSEBAI_4867 [Salmonella enterica subsp. enterica serovar Baildon str. R6-199]|nr:hypothetical protein LTSEBAI_4867 [Salmonella enterica subsp. enterica serovar Baildon str. R6-199]